LTCSHHSFKQPSHQAALSAHSPLRLGNPLYKDPWLQLGVTDHLKELPARAAVRGWRATSGNRNEQEQKVNAVGAAADGQIEFVRAQECVRGCSWAASTHACRPKQTAMQQPVQRQANEQRGQQHSSGSKLQWLASMLPHIQL
jgi:hypothetical protein